MEHESSNAKTGQISDPSVKQMFANPLRPIGVSSPRVYIYRALYQKSMRQHTLALETKITALTLSLLASAGHQPRASVCG